MRRSRASPVATSTTVLVEVDVTPSDVSQVGLYGVPCGAIRRLAVPVDVRAPTFTRVVSTIRPQEP